MAHLLTTTHRTGDKARRAGGAALLFAAAVVSAIGLAAAVPGFFRALAIFAATVFLLLALGYWSTGYDLRQRERAEQALLRSLAGRLPDRWYVVADLQLEPSWQEPVQIWATVVGPGGVAVIQPCSEGGELTPFGHIWMAGRGKAVRAIPSPAAEACTAAEALREVIGSEAVPVIPVVALTDMNAIFHQAETGAQVVGAPHLAEGLRRQLGAGQRIWDALHLAAYLSHYHR